MVKPDSSKLSIREKWNSARSNKCAALEDGIIKKIIAKME